MSSPRHKLCDLLDESPQVVEQEDELANNQEETDEHPTETWQFDPGICG